MSTFTTNYNLEKPETGVQTGWDAALNGNADTIDAQLKANANAIAAIGTPATLPIAESDVTNLVTDLAAKASTSALTSGLAGKANTSHTHAESDVTNLVTDLAAKAPTVHTHAASDLASGQVALARGGTAVDLSATGGTTKILAQDAAHLISARDLVAADIPSLAASKITTGALALARGGTGVDLSATGGTTKILAQDASQVISARDLVAADIPNLDAAKITTGVLAAARGGVANLAGTTGFFPLLASPFGLVSIAANAGGASNNQVRCIRFVLLERTVVSRATLTCSAAVSGATFACAIYDSSLNRLIQWGTFDGNSATTQSLTAGAITLDAGEYWFAWSNSNVSATMQCFVINNVIGAIIGKTNTNFGSSSNVYSSGMPSSLGTITSITSSINVACVYIEAA